MSRIGKKPVVIPSGVKVEKKDLTLTVTGPKGTLTLALHPKINLSINDKEILLDVADKEDKREKALWGLFRSLVQNLVDGVTKGFEKKLEVNGVGFKVELTKAEQALEAYKRKQKDGASDVEYAVRRLPNFKGQILEMRLGFAHPVFLQIPSNLTVTLEKNVITVTGADKQLVGQFAAEIRELKKPEPYKGKGIKYADETIVRKAGKVVKVVGGGK
jgi:large subunit ribosomal protein L6